MYIYVKLLSVHASSLVKTDAGEMNVRKQQETAESER